MRLNRKVTHTLYIYYTCPSAIQSRTHCRYWGVSMHTLYRVKEEASLRRGTRGVGGIDACGRVGATDKHVVPDSEGSSFKDCHQ